MGIYSQAGVVSAWTGKEILSMLVDSNPSTNEQIPYALRKNIKHIGISISFPYGQINFKLANDKTITMPSADYYIIFPPAQPAFILSPKNFKTYYIRTKNQ
jgi:hypothetical protein